MGQSIGKAGDFQCVGRFCCPVSPLNSPSFSKRALLQVWKKGWWIFQSSWYLVSFFLVCFGWKKQYDVFVLCCQLGCPHSQWIVADEDSLNQQLFLGQRMMCLTWLMWLLLGETSYATSFRHDSSRCFLNFAKNRGVLLPTQRLTPGFLQTCVCTNKSPTGEAVSVCFAVQVTRLRKAEKGYHPKKCVLSICQTRLSFVIAGNWTLI